MAETLPDGVWQALANDSDAADLTAVLLPALDDDGVSQRDRREQVADAVLRQMLDVVAGPFAWGPARCFVDARADSEGKRSGAVVVVVNNDDWRPCGSPT